MTLFLLLDVNVVNDDVGAKPHTVGAESKIAVRPMVSFIVIVVDIGIVAVVVDDVVDVTVV